MSIAMWIKPKDLIATQTLFNSWESSNGAYLFQLGRVDNLLSWSNNNALDAVSVGTITDNEWHHVVATRSGTLASWDITFYIDGQKEFQYLCYHHH